MENIDSFILCDCFYCIQDIWYTLDLLNTIWPSPFTIWPSPLTDELVKFTKPIKDAEVIEKEEVTFTCEINKIGKKPIWSLNDDKLTPGDRVKTISKGLVHKLTIEKSKLHDEGKYTVAFGEATLSATLIVKGIIFSHLLSLHTYTLVV